MMILASRVPEILKCWRGDPFVFSRYCFRAWRRILNHIIQPEIVGNMAFRLITIAVNDRGVYYSLRFQLNKEAIDNVKKPNKEQK
jgi:hypothetical protein